MDTTSGAFAVELHRHSPTHWVATFYPLASTPAGCWADVTSVLHRALMPVAHRPMASTRWLEATSPDPAHPCYDRHRYWGAALAAGYAAARLAHATTTHHSANTARSPNEARQLLAATTVVPAGQLTEWLLDDLHDAEL